MASPLPVQAVLPEVTDALRSTGTCVLVAPTGAGKTTRMPPALVEAGLGPVVVLEPRRIAARAAARRVAFERGETLGEEVGYQVRFERRTSAKTRLTFMTEGIFVRRLQDDPFLEGIGCIVLDEFHERSLDLDLSLALVRRIQLEARDDLGLVVTSATLDAEQVARYLDDAPIVRSEGRSFPVTTRHLPPASGEREEEHVARGVREAVELQDGHVLTFLPGRREIRRTKEALADLGRARGIELVELYGELSAKDQDAVLQPSEKRKVVLATNVAESSITVPGVSSVVDTGLVRRLRHHPGSGLDRLVLERVSVASADQRSGRAGREAAGLCLRLWSAAEHRTLSAFEPPEVQRADLTGVALQLLLFGENDLWSFPWFERPSEKALTAALDLARMLGAIDGGGRFTDLGRRLARIPAHPRLARLLLDLRVGESLQGDLLRSD